MTDEELVEIFRCAVYGEDWKDKDAILDSQHTAKGLRAVLDAVSRREIQRLISLGLLS